MDSARLSKPLQRRTEPKSRAGLDRQPAYPNEDDTSLLRAVSYPNPALDSRPSTGAKFLPIQPVVRTLGRNPLFSQQRQVNQPCGQEHGLRNANCTVRS